MAAPTAGPCGPWITRSDVQLCCNLSEDVNVDLLDRAIDFATNILWGLSGRQYPGVCSRTVRPCFPAGTLITTEHGPTPIEDVEAGTLVLTHRGRWRRVIEGGQTGHAPLVSLRGQGATLRTTADHGIWASEVLPMDWTARKVKLGAPEWRDASEMIGHAWATPRDIEPLPVPLPSGHETLDWWMVGRWLGDGWTHVPREGASYRGHDVMICCGHHEEDGVRERLAETPYRWRESKMATATRFTTTSKTLALWLRQHFGVGAAGKQIPGWALAMPQVDREALLNGYVSADGSRRPEGRNSIRNRVRCGTVSYALATSVRMLAVSLGYPATIGPRKQTSTEIEGRKINGHDWWAVEWLEGPTRSTWQDEGDGLLWGRVRSIEQDTLIAVPVYNITVDEDHSYIADGIAVKNCFGDNCGCAGPGWLQWPQGGWSFWVWDQAAMGWSFPSIPYRIDGEWFNFGGACDGQCHLDGVTLPPPIGTVTEVVIDGEVLAPTAYAIQEFRRVVRLDGERWPCTQRANIDSSPYAGPNDGSKRGTWQIAYEYGRGPGPAGVAACARFACEVAKAWCNSADCQLPARLKHIVREGVDMDFADPLSFIGKGEVGVYEVDLWINNVNPGGITRRATIQRLDGPRRYTGFTG